MNKTDFQTGKSDIDLMVIGAAALEEILKRIREPEETPRQGNQRFSF